MNKTLSILVWVAIGALGALGFGVLALSRGETISAGWLVIAGVCAYLVAYRFYSRYLAYTVFGLDDRRATPAERLNNGRDFCPTNKWVAAGHHFSAISGAGPLVGPTLAAQFGFLPGTIWLIAGVVLGGAVQDMIVLCASVRRDGKSLGQMAKDEVNPIAGMAAMIAVFAIMIILLAVLALVVVNALRDSPWGLFTIAATIPILLYFISLFLQLDGYAAKNDVKGVPVDEFLGSMGFISNALAVNCTYCHLGEGGGGWDEYAKDNAKKVMARTMIVMVNTINKTHFGGRKVVTCVTCHNGSNVPATIRKLDAVYNTPTTDEPVNVTRQAPGAPSADQVLDKYIAAVGGADRLAKLTSWTAKGTYIGYGDAEAVPLEIYIQTRDPRYLELGKRLADAQWAPPSTRATTCPPRASSRARRGSMR